VVEQVMWIMECAYNLLKHIMINEQEDEVEEDEIESDDRQRYLNHPFTEHTHID
jgi:hypothetical protein